MSENQSVMAGIIGGSVFLLLHFACSMQLCAVSFVYNLRVAEITRRYALTHQSITPSILVVTGIDQMRKHVNDVRDNLAGNLLSYLFLQDNVYLKADFAYGHAHQWSPDSCFERMQADDLLLTAGYSVMINPRARITFSGMVGFPTHRDTGLIGLEIGTGHTGIGGQFDSSYILSAHNQHSQHYFLSAARYIRFLPESVAFPPTVPFRNAELDIGNLVDLLVAYSYRFGLSNIEIGYNPSFLFHATITPSVSTLDSQLNYIRSNLYASYRYIFVRERHSCGIIAGLSYGFDEMPRILKHIITAWVSWGVNF